MSKLLNLGDLAEILKEGAAECGKYEHCMALDVHADAQAVELLLDTGCGRTYSDWIPGEGSDIGLIREVETERIVGISLPLLNNRLCVHHDGPIRINAGFRKDETP